MDVINIVSRKIFFDREGIEGRKRTNPHNRYVNSVHTWTKSRTNPAPTMPRPAIRKGMKTWMVIAKYDSSGSFSSAAPQILLSATTSGNRPLSVPSSKMVTSKQSSVLCPLIVEFAVVACPLVLVSFDSEVVRERPSVGVILWEFCFSGSKGSLHCSLSTEEQISVTLMLNRSMSRIFISPSFKR